jgi:hypothetical protein
MQSWKEEERKKVILTVNCCRNRVGSTTNGDKKNKKDFEFPQ